MSLVRERPPRLGATSSERMDRSIQTPLREKAGAKDIRLVAKKARVSCSTVSRVTNGCASVDTRLANRVWQAIKETGYVPNPQARALVSGRSRTLGLLISQTTNPLFPDLVQSFEVMVGSADSSHDRAECFVKRLTQRRVEGVAVMTFNAESRLLEELIDHQIPLVTIDFRADAPLSAVLEIDYLGGLTQAVQHLAALGHRRIAFAGGPAQCVTSRRRKEAFVQAIRSSGLSPDESPVFEGDLTFDGGTQAACTFLDSPIRPTAIICSTDMMAFGALRVLARQKISVPDKMSVVGFDDVHHAAFATPSLTTIRMCRDELAKTAFRALQSFIGAEPKVYRDAIRINTSLVVRQSTTLSPRLRVPASRPT
jgi:DNA-binding LacI/PurR family transcriptional regulator